MSTQTLHQELNLAFTFREHLLDRKPQNQSIKMYDAIEPELLKLLYAKNKDLADLAYEKIQTILMQNLDLKNEQDHVLKALIDDLHQQRNRYLTPVSKGFLGLWAEENWIGANFALLIFPLLAAPFYPLVGIPLLAYTSAVAGAAVVDVVRKSPDYWLEEQSPLTRELTPEQCDEFKKQYHDIALFLPENNAQKTFKLLNQQSYGLYVLALGIALIGLGSILFPPIGIPTLALTILSLIALTSTAFQALLLIQKQKQNNEEIEHEAQSQPVARYEQHDSAVFVHQHLPQTKLKKQTLVEQTELVKPTIQSQPALQDKPESEETSSDDSHIHP